jgi:hypothetical protein
MKKGFAQCSAFFHLVAGIRFARMPTGYEPVEVLLLQPATKLFYSYLEPKQALFIK